MHILGHDILRQLAIDHNLDGLRHLDPEGSGAQNSCHLGVTDAGGKCSHTAVGGGVAVRSEHHMPRALHSRPPSSADGRCRHFCVHFSCHTALQMRLPRGNGWCHPAGWPEPDGHRSEPPYPDPRALQSPSPQTCPATKGIKMSSNHDAVHIYGDNISRLYLLCPYYDDMIFSIIVCPIFYSSLNPVRCSLRMAFTSPPASQ